MTWFIGGVQHSGNGEVPLPEGVGDKDLPKGTLQA